jgi:hypothetical protein
MEEMENSGIAGRHEVEGSNPSKFTKRFIGLALKGRCAKALAGRNCILHKI